jgi:hypothetical protein
MGILTKVKLARILKVRAFLFISVSPPTENKTLPLCELTARHI